MSDLEKMIDMFSHAGFDFYVNPGGDTDFTTLGFYNNSQEFYFNSKGDLVKL